MFLNTVKKSLGCVPILFCSFVWFSHGAIPDLPEPVANNAVAFVETGQGKYVFSFMGLAKGKTFQDVHNKAWRLKWGESSWQAIAPVPSSLPLKGRLASIAVGVGEQVYLFGGYTVAEDHSEISSPDNYRYEVSDNTYHRIADTPVPVDDAVALVYQQRYIYLISGWHNDGNVNLVQVYDVKNNSWKQASPFLGQPVFGHAGGIVGNSMLICDGVKVVPLTDKRRTFAPETACYQGQISQQDICKVDWRVIAHPTKVARYRMAATGDADKNRILFYGGSDNPYNYNGIGYNGAPAEPDGHVWIYELEKGVWNVMPTRAQTMDHRGLIPMNGHFLVIGGMLKSQQVTAQVNQVPFE